MTLNFQTSEVFCPHCGYIRQDELSQLDQKAQSVRAEATGKVVKLTHRGAVNAYAQAAWETGHDYLRRGDRAEALKAFQRSVDIQSDFADGHLWIAKTVDDEPSKREHLGAIVAHFPNHPEATRMLMVLNGRLSAEDVARTDNSSVEPALQKAEEIAAKIKALLCPQCGGRLTVNEAKKRVECVSCGFSAAQPSAAGIGEDSLLAALIERRAKPIRWNIGKRTFQCRECGAEHTLTAEKLTAQCRFCGSQNVLLNDTLGTFEQPHGMIRFQVSGEQALSGIEQSLKTISGKLGSLFGNQVVKIDPPQAVYLPFWAFDVDIEVSRTLIQYSTLFQDIPPMRFPEMMNDLVYCAVQHLPEALREGLEDYDLSATIPYDPKWLARVPAEVYTLDVDKASIEVRGRVQKRMRLKYPPEITQTKMDDRGKERQEITRHSTHIQAMALQLLLLPVWSATLLEKDGDTRLALVNGQTGKVTMGLYRKKERAT
jgi:DNA-directed RNA polymerase subunit RPC12/RpoP